MFEDHTLKEYVSRASSAPFPFTFLFSCLPVVHTSIYLFMGSWFIMPIFVWKKCIIHKARPTSPSSSLVSVTISLTDFLLLLYR